VPSSLGFRLLHQVSESLETWSGALPAFWLGRGGLVTVALVESSVLACAVVAADGVEDEGVCAGKLQVPFSRPVVGVGLRELSVVVCELTTSVEEAEVRMLLAVAADSYGLVVNNIFMV
jgi:hypothetical protein